MAGGAAAERRFGSLRHLAARFFSAVSPASPSAQSDDWARSWLLPGERELWKRMSGPDRRHAVAVARESSRLLEEAVEKTPGEVLAAALLHDVGKVEAHLGTLSRVAVTVAAGALGHERIAACARLSRHAWLKRVGCYLAHDRVGGEMLRACGSDPFTVAWAEQHHLPPERWTVDARTARLLKAADGGRRGAG